MDCFCNPFDAEGTEPGLVFLLLWPPTSTSWNEKLHTWHGVCGVPTHRRHHQTWTETFINSEHCSPWSPCLTDTRSGTKVEKCSHPLVWRLLVWDFCLCSRRAQLLLSNLNDMNYTLQDSSKQPCWWRRMMRVEEVEQKNQKQKRGYATNSHRRSWHRRSCSFLAFAPVRGPSLFSQVRILLSVTGPPNLLPPSPLPCFRFILHQE